MCNSESNERSLVVGYAFMSKKSRSMSATMESVGDGLIWRPIDLERLTSGHPLSEQGPFDIVIHKLSEDIHETNELANNDADPGSIQRIRAIEEFAATHPLIPIVDPPAAVARVVSRIKTCEILACLHGTQIGPHSSNRRLVSPRYVVARSGVSRQTCVALENELIAKSISSGPLLCKPAEACGPGASHMLTILLDRPSTIFQEMLHIKASLNDDHQKEQKDADLHWLSQPTVVQEYVNHDGVLLKVYVIGDTVRLFSRKSLPNLPRTRPFVSHTVTSVAPPLSPIGIKRRLSDVSDMVNSETGEVVVTPRQTTPKGVVLFESQKPYPTYNELFRDAGYHEFCIDSPSSEDELPNQDYNNNSELLECVKDAASKLREVFGLSLFGFDCVIPQDSNDLMVLDVNYFPSYKELKTDFPSLLSSYFMNLKREAQSKHVLASSSSSSVSPLALKKERQHQESYLTLDSTSTTQVRVR